MNNWENLSLRIVWFTFLLTTLNIGFAQNAMDFDGIDDYINVPNASALIANGEISMAFWVYPTNPFPSYPNFDGIAGFRNDFNADFYVLHLNTTTVEARFRNSLGTNFDIAFSGIVVNEWNHFVMILDSTTLTLYHNGAFGASIPASGFITSTTEPLNIGYLPFSTPNFHLDGQLDDVCLWSRALSAKEVEQVYNACSVNLSSPDLKACYEFNEGIAEGDNTALLTVLDSKDSLDGTINFMALDSTFSNFVAYGKNTFSTLNDTAGCSYTSPSGTYSWDSSGTYRDTLVNAAGCDSVITINLTLLGTTTGSSIIDTACNSYLSPGGSQVWTISGLYADTLLSSAGCDSIVTVDLTINTVDVTVSIIGDTLSSNAVGAGYQWLDCDLGFASIGGGINQAFVPTSNGAYAVQVTENGCVDTSACIDMMPIGIDHGRLLAGLSVYPNPASGAFVIELPEVYSDVTIEIYDLIGKRVFVEEYLNRDEIAIQFDRPPGIYLVKIQTAHESAGIKLISE